MISLGRPDHFRLVQQYLRERYTEEIAAGALGIASLADFASRDPRRQLRDPLTRLFFAGAAVPAAELRGVMSAPVMEAFGSLGLLRFADEQNR